MTGAAVLGAVTRGVVGTVTLMAIGAAPAATDQGEPGVSGPPPAALAGAGVDAAASSPEDATSSPGSGPVAALLPSASVRAATRAATTPQEGLDRTGPRAGGMGLPTLLQGVATWLRDDLPRHRRVLLYELDRGRSRVAGVLPRGPMVPGLAVLAGLAGLGLTVRRRRAAASGPEPAAPPPDPAPTSRSERARRLMAEGAGAARAARESGLGRDGLQLLDRLAKGPAGSGGVRPWGGDVPSTAASPDRHRTRSAGPAPFHAVTGEMDPPAPSPGEGGP